MRYVITVLIFFFGKFLESSLTSSSSRGYVSEKELECFSQEKIYHKPTDKCYRLLTTGPCRRGHWFVLEKPKEALRGTVNVTIKAKCEREICPEGQLYWRKTNSCVSAKDKKKLCGDVIGEELRTNVFGEGECMCLRHPPWARFNGDRKKRCYPLYTQGPCPPAQIFGYLKKLERATCVPDPCYAETLHKRRNKIIAKDAILAPWENGTCYELDTRGPCPEFFTFKPPYDPGLLTPLITGLEKTLSTLLSSLNVGVGGLLGGLTGESNGPGAPGGLVGPSISQISLPGLSQAGAAGVGSGAGLGLGGLKMALAQANAGGSGAGGSTSGASGAGGSTSGASGAVGSTSGASGVGASGAGASGAGASGAGASNAGASSSGASSSGQSATPGLGSAFGKVMTGTATVADVKNGNPSVATKTETGIEQLGMQILSAGTKNLNLGNLRISLILSSIVTWADNPKVGSIETKVVEMKPCLDATLGRLKLCASSSIKTQRISPSEVEERVNILDQYNIAKNGKIEHFIKYLKNLGQ